MSLSPSSGTHASLGVPGTQAPACAGVLALAARPALVQALPGRRGGARAAHRARTRSRAAGAPRFHTHSLGSEPTAMFCVNAARGGSSLKAGHHWSQHHWTIRAARHCTPAASSPREVAAAGRRPAPEGAPPCEAAGHGGARRRASASGKHCRRRDVGTLQLCWDLPAGTRRDPLPSSPGGSPSTPAPSTSS